MSEDAAFDARLDQAMEAMVEEGLIARKREGGEAFYWPTDLGWMTVIKSLVEDRYEDEYPDGVSPDQVMEVVFRILPFVVDEDLEEYL